MCGVYLISVLVICMYECIRVLLLCTMASLFGKKGVLCVCVLYDVRVSVSVRALLISVGGICMCGCIRGLLLCIMASLFSGAPSQLMRDHLNLFLDISISGLKNMCFSR